MKQLCKVIQSRRDLDFGLHISKNDYTTSELRYDRLDYLQLQDLLKMNNMKVVGGMPCLQANNRENHSTS